MWASGLFWIRWVYAEVAVTPNLPVEGKHADSGQSLDQRSQRSWLGVLEEIDFVRTWVHVGLQRERSSKSVSAQAPVDLIQDSVTYRSQGRRFDDLCLS
jgi:hypothetical protein